MNEPSVLLSARPKKPKLTAMPLLMLRPRPSLGLRMALVALHGLLLGAVFLAALPWWLSVLLGVGLGLSAWRVWLQVLPVRGVQWGRDGVWQLELRNGERVGARLNAKRSRSWLGWVYLDYQTEDGQRVGLTLAADSLNADEFRRLRTRLKMVSSF
ncbi:MAG: protein YgfX [Halothiobacillaceae bacterium]